MTMKKIALFCAAAAMAAGAFAGDGYKFKFSSSGDTYADGTPVQDGEVYALVWTKTGVFAGFNADGTLADPEGSDLMCMSFASGGGCPTTVFIADERHEGGFYQMFLLDTRAYSADGVAGAPAGVGAGNVLTSVKGYSAVVSAKFTATTANLAGVASTTVDGSVGAELPADVPVPVITKVEVAGGKVLVTVGNIVPYVQYTVSGGKTPKAEDQRDMATVLSREAGTLTLAVSDPGENRFFKVVNK